MYFAISNILPIAYIAFGTALAAMLWLLWPYRMRIRIGSSASSDDDETSAAPLPPVSVLIYACCNPESLEKMLPMVLEQDYPAEFEVIVVNDGSSSELSDVVKRLAHTHGNLYQTFVPEEAHNLSRKKLAVSLGIKAAKTDYVVLTTADCRPCSHNWLRLMARHFAEGKQVVLGWGRISGLKSAMEAFDQAATGVTWLSAASHGHPYRGTAMNLAYARKLFFDAKGFSRTLNLHHGDDDLFINQIATPGNTAVELSPKARMNASFHNPSKVWHDLKLRHTFTARRLPKGQSRLMGFSTLMMWVWLGAMATCAVFTIPNMLPSCILLLMIPALWVPLTLAWRRTGRVLGLRLRAPFLWWQMLWRWIPDIRAKMSCASAERRNYTWLQK